MTCISVTARRSLSAYHEYTVYVLIVAAFHSADYFVSCTRYCLDATCKRTENFATKKSFLPDKCHRFIFSFLSKSDKLFFYV